MILKIKPLKIVIDAGLDGAVDTHKSLSTLQIISSTS